MGSKILFRILLMGALLTLAACAGDTGPQGEPGATGPAGPQGAAGEAAAPAQIDVADLSCAGCHDDTTLLAGKTTAWSESLHGTGESYVRGSSASCAGCHSGGAFSEMIATGGNPGAMEAGDPDPTRQDCRSCHAVHTSYTDADWALETSDAVELYAFEGATFDGGSGNLCTNCHQPRRGID